jgi:hypothetical protein
MGIRHPKQVKHFESGAIGLHEIVDGRSAEWRVEPHAIDGDSAQFSKDRSTHGPQYNRARHTTETDIGRIFD